MTARCMLEDFGRFHELAGEVSALEVADAAYVLLLSIRAG